MSLRTELRRILYEKGKPMTIHELMEITGKDKAAVWRTLSKMQIEHDIRKLEVDEGFNTKFRWELTEAGIKQHMYYFKMMVRR